MGAGSAGLCLCAWGSLRDPRPPTKNGNCQLGVPAAPPAAPIGRGARSAPPTAGRPRRRVFPGFRGCNSWVTPRLKGLSGLQPTPTCLCLGALHGAGDGGPGGEALFAPEKKGRRPRSRAARHLGVGPPMEPVGGGARVGQWFPLPPNPRARAPGGAGPAPRRRPGEPTGRRADKHPSPHS